MELFYTDLQYANTFQEYLLSMINDQQQMIDIKNNYKVFVPNRIYSNNLEYKKTFELNESKYDLEDGFYKMKLSEYSSWVDEFYCLIETGEIKHVLFDCCQVEYLRELLDFENAKSIFVYDNINDYLFDKFNLNYPQNNDLRFAFETNDINYMKETNIEFYEDMKSCRKGTLFLLRRMLRQVEREVEQEEDDPEL